MKSQLHIMAAFLLVTVGLGYSQTYPVVRVTPIDSPQKVLNTGPQKTTPKEVKATEYELAKPEKTDEFYFLLQSHPNLQSGKAKVEVTISKVGSATIQLMNYRGDKIKMIYKGQLSVGTNFLSFDSTNLPDGLYYIITDLNGQQYADKFLVERK